MNLTPLDGWIGEKIGAPGSRLERPALESYQLMRLNETLQHVTRHSVFYRKHLAGCPSRLESLDEITGLPFTTADDLRRVGLEMVCVSQAEIDRVVTLDTSGTTGNPKRLYFTRQDQELTIDFFHRGMTTFTRPGDRVMILLPFERPGSVGDLLARGLHRLGATPVLYGPVRDPLDALMVIKREKITGIVGAPTHVLALARFFGLEAKTGAWTPKQVLLSTDHAPAVIMTAIQEAWGCAVYDHYGMTEMGLGVGVECQARSGYHLREADLYAEIIDPVSDVPVMDGQPGEVVFTTLTRRGMPLIRYRSGDEGCYRVGPCACGTVLKTMERLHRRYSGVVSLNARRPGAGLTVADPVEGDLVMADLDEALFSRPAVLNFCAALTGDAVQTCLHLNMTLMPGASVDWPVQVEEALENIPAVQAARRDRRLEVQIEGQEYPGLWTGSLAKRQIFNRRSGLHAANLE